jgi:dGTPase
MPEQLNQLGIWRLMCERLDWQGGTLSEIDRHRFIREIVGLEVEDVIQETGYRLQQLKPQTPDDVQRHGDNVVNYSGKLHAMNHELKNFLYENMYSHFRVVRMAKRAQRFLEEIFTSYIKEPKQLPKDSQAKIANEGKHRVVADYIASMTDRSALLEYRRLFDPLMRP